MNPHSPQTASVLIIDDEGHARRNLELALEEFSDWRLAASCDNTTKAAAILANQDVDLVLLDIRMPTQNGLDFAKELCRRPRPPLIAFVTAYDDHAIEAFDLFAIDYLLKPFDDQRFALLLARARSMLDLRERMMYSQAVEHFIADQSASQSGRKPPRLSYFSVRSVGSVERIPVDEVAWIKSAGNYIELHLANRVVLHRCAMNEIENRLPSHEFLRLHRTAIVRRAVLRRLMVHQDSTYSAEIAGGEILPVSARYLADIKQELAQS